jgi:hypothetical protein
MTKKVLKNRGYNSSYDKYDDEVSQRGQHDRLKDHRKEKRITNALRSKNLDDLLDEDEE